MFYFPFHTSRTTTLESWFEIKSLFRMLFVENWKLYVKTSCVCFFCRFPLWSRKIQQCGGSPYEEDKLAWSVWAVERGCWKGCCCRQQRKAHLFFFPCLLKYWAVIFANLVVGCWTERWVLGGNGETVMRFTLLNLLNLCFSEHDVWNRTPFTDLPMSSCPRGN